MVDPLTYAKLGMTAVGVLRKAGGWAIVEWQDAKAMDELLRSAIARAVCPERPGDSSVLAVVDAVDGALRTVDFPSRHPPRLKRIAGWFIDRVTRKGARRPLRPIPLDGPGFFVLFGLWVQAAFEQSLPQQELMKVDCPPRGTPAVRAVVARIPDQLHTLVYKEQASPFCERMARLLEQNERNRLWAKREIGKDRFREFLISLGVTAATFGVSELALPGHRGPALISVLVGLGAQGVQQKLRQSKIKSVRGRALLDVTDKLAEQTGLYSKQSSKGSERPFAEDHARPPDPNLCDRIQRRATEAMQSGEVELAETLNNLDSCITHWQAHPNNENARGAAGEALDDVAHFLATGELPPHYE